MDTRFSESKYIKLEIKDSIIIGTYTNDFQIDLEGAKQIVKQRILFQAGNEYPGLVDVNQLKSMNKEARDYFAEKGGEGLLAMAVVANSFVSKIVANMFITFSKPKVPTKAFQHRADAIKWLSQFIKQI